MVFENSLTFIPIVHLHSLPWLQLYNNPLKFPLVTIGAEENGDFNEFLELFNDLYDQWNFLLLSLWVVVLWFCWYATINKSENETVCWLYENVFDI